MELARKSYDQDAEKNLQTLERDLKAAALEARQMPAVGRKSLVIYLPALAGGGVERLRLHLAPVFVKAGYDVTFLLHRAEGELITAVPKDIRIVPLNCTRTLYALWPMVRFLRREKPDIVLSSLGHNNIMAIWACALAGVKKTRVIVCQHNAMSSEKVRGDEFNYWVLPFVSRMFLGKADGIMCVSQGVADDLAKVTGLPRDRISVIYNPVVFRDFDSRMSEPVSHRWFGVDKPPVILGVGRFVEQKDFAMLIEAFAKVTAKKDARLILLGDGPLRGALNEQAQKLGVADKIDMPGFQQNPLPWMKEASVLAMSSRYEGFGNVLVEALACGTPVVSTDCTYGPSEILANGKFGPLVPVGDADAMAKALLATLEKPSSTETLRGRGKEFTVERAADQYIGLFNQVKSRA